MSYTEDAEMNAVRKENERIREENRVLRIQKDELYKMVCSLTEILSTYNR